MIQCFSFPSLVLTMNRLVKVTLFLSFKKFVLSIFFVILPLNRASPMIIFDMNVIRFQGCSGKVQSWALALKLNWNRTLGCEWNWRQNFVQKQFVKSESLIAKIAVTRGSTTSKSGSETTQISPRTPSAFDGGEVRQGGTVSKVYKCVQA